MSATWPYTWHTISENVNDTLYLGILATTDNIQLGMPIKLSPQVYNKDELFAKIKASLTAMSVNGTPPKDPGIEHDLATNTLSITSLGFEESSWGWRFWSDQELTTGRSSFFGALTTAHSANFIFSNEHTTTEWSYETAPLTVNVNLQPVRNIYVHSTLGNMATLSSRVLRTS